MTSTADKAALLDSLHVPGTPLIVTNVWDALSAHAVAGAAGVKAIASASHSVANTRGFEDGEGMNFEQALAAATSIIDAVDLPVTIDFERGYTRNLAKLRDNVTRLMQAGAAGINFEDSTGLETTPLTPLADQEERIRTIRGAADALGIPLVINARVDSLVRGGDWDDALTRANAYLAAGASVIFMLGLGDEAAVEKAIAGVDGRVSTISGPKSVPLTRLAELGISRVSFGPYTLGLALASLQNAAAHLTALGEYPKELGFEYSLEDARRMAPLVEDHHEEV
ncbi:MAG: PEP phosphonomutase [Micrococcales bacterium 70-64]|mgnify:CR=1 FL=1|nr:isocitrate lyase/phosphoenolpyruvate mutase family protein [Leifsonia sp.]ODU63769.1 MAG: PEP phosphonomutase [Leifsonia sp. SCN 70-46]OJX85460.1 MAG: PEP phosphonomutase [Micrococcales bacterium 70-64]